MSATAAPMAPGAVLPQAPAATNGANGAQANGAQANGAPKAEAPKPEAPKEPASTKKKLKVGGKEFEIDFADQARLERELAIGLDARQKREAELKELAELRAERKLLKENPWEAAKKHGHSLEEQLLQKAQREAQLAELTPEQRRIVELEQALQEREAAQQKAEQERQQTREQRRRQAFRNQMQSQVIESLKHVGMDITGKGNAATRGAMLSLAAKIQARTIRAGRPAFTPEQLGAEVQKTWLLDTTRISGLVTAAPEFRAKNAEALRSHIDALTNGLEGNDLLQFVGSGFIRRVVQAQLAALQGGQRPTEPPAQTNQPQIKQLGGDVPLDYYEMRRRMLK